MEYNENMVKTEVYLPERMVKAVESYADKQNKTISEVIATVLEPKFHQKKPTKGGGVETLFKIAALSEKYKTRGPKDLAINMEKYLYGQPIRKKKKYKNSGAFLLELAREAEEKGISGPANLSKNVDKYLYGSK